MYRFDLELETFVGWTEDWEKDQWKTDGAMNRVLFSNKYNHLCFILPDTDHMYFIHEEDIVFRRHYGWVIFAQCNMTGFEEDEVTIFLAVTLIQKTPQIVKVMHPEEGINYNRVLDLNEENE